jgi:hypothetical protein
MKKIKRVSTPSNGRLKYAALQRFRDEGKFMYIYALWKQGKEKVLIK